MNEAGVELLEPFSDFRKALDPAQDWAQFREIDKGRIGDSGNETEALDHSLAQEKFYDALGEWTVGRPEE
jgi:hypothetical protein